MSSHFASNVLPGAAIARGYAGLVAADIADAQGAHMPEGVSANHPTFVYGHLAIYPDRVFKSLGREDLAQTDARYEELFSPMVSCEHDADGGKYPPLSEVVARYTERTDALLAFLKTVDDATFSKPNPNEAMRDRFPTLGALAAFMIQGHTMMHLGQISTWRRVMGLGEAMPRPRAPASPEPAKA